MEMAETDCPSHAPGTRQSHVKIDPHSVRGACLRACRRQDPGAATSPPVDGGEEVLAVTPGTFPRPHESGERWPAKPDGVGASTAVITRLQECAASAFVAATGDTDFSSVSWAKAPCPFGARHSFTPPVMPASLGTMMTLSGTISIFLALPPPI